MSDSIVRLGIPSLRTPLARIYCRFCPRKDIILGSKVFCSRGLAHDMEIAIGGTKVRPSVAPHASTPSQIHLLVAVYGKKFTALFAEITAANLVALVDEIPPVLRGASKVRILTTADDALVLEDAPSIQKLRTRIQVEILNAVKMSGFERYGGHGPMCLALAHGVEEASAVGAALIFVPPDVVFSNGSFATLIRAATNGYRAVIGPSLRAKLEPLHDRFLQIMMEKGGSVLQVDARELAQLIFEHWHPINDRYWWDSRGEKWKAFAYFGVSDRTLLIRFFQGPMFYAWPLRRIEKYDGWIDHGLVALCCERFEQVHVIEDSDQFLNVDLTPNARLDHHEASVSPDIDLLKQLLDMKYINRFNVDYGSRSCVVHADDVDPAAIAAARSILSRQIDPVIALAKVLRKPIRVGFLLRRTGRYALARLLSAPHQLLLLGIRGLLMIVRSFTSRRKLF
jgi:hypothetical protein